MTLEPSHVLIAIGLRHEEAHGSLRLKMMLSPSIKLNLKLAMFGRRFVL
jgi:hypothetical protein